MNTTNTENTLLKQIYKWTNLNKKSPCYKIDPKKLKYKKESLKKPSIIESKYLNIKMKFPNGDQNVTN